MDSRQARRHNKTTSLYKENKTGAATGKNKGTTTAEGRKTDMRTIKETIESH